MKFCPITQAHMESHSSCPQADCVFRISGGCAMVVAAKKARDAEDTLRDLKNMAQRIQSRVG